MYATNEFRKGLKIEYNNKPFVIVDFQHVSPGKGSAFTRTRIKNMESGQVLEVTLKSGDKVPKADVEQKQMQYLYKEGDIYTFMDNKTYDQVTLTEEQLGDAKFFILENSNVDVTFFQGKALTIDVATFVELRVKETQPNIKGDTSGGGGKPAIMETGLTVQVPFHISEGDLLKIDSRDRSYVEKVNKK